jgi:glycerophosphoryl diester phosphodiesterase
MASSSSEKRPLLMAHRGGEGRWPSNTLFAFEQAVRLGADSLEMDLQRTADGLIVVRHDPFVESTTDGAGLIQDFTLADLKELDAGYTWTDDNGRTFPFRGKGITIPTLAEVLQAFPTTHLNIDIKPKEAQVVHQFSELLHKFGRLENITVGSFHDDQLRLFRRLCPHTPTAAGVTETRTFFLLSQIFLDRFYHPQAKMFQIPEYASFLRLVSRRFIQTAHAQGLPVHVWTVNERADMLRLIEWGVDGIITDYPDILAAILEHPQTSLPE